MAVSERSKSARIPGEQPDDRSDRERVRDQLNEHDAPVDACGRRVPSYGLGIDGRFCHELISTRFSRKSRATGAASPPPVPPSSMTTAKAIFWGRPSPSAKPMNQAWVFSSSPVPNSAVPVLPPTVSPSTSAAVPVPPVDDVEHQLADLGRDRVGDRDGLGGLVADQPRCVPGAGLGGGGDRGHVERAGQDLGLADRRGTQLDPTGGKWEHAADRGRADVVLHVEPGVRGGRVECLGAQVLGEGDEPGVARVDEDLGERHVAQRLALEVADRVAVDLDLGRAGHDLVGGHAAVQQPGAGHHLEGRARRVLAQEGSVEAVGRRAGDGQDLTGLWHRSPPTRPVRGASASAASAASWTGTENVVVTGWGSVPSLLSRVPTTVSPSNSSMAWSTPPASVASYSASSPLRPTTSPACVPVAQLVELFGRDLTDVADRLGGEGRRGQLGLAAIGEHQAGHRVEDVAVDLLVLLDGQHRDRDPTVGGDPRLAQRGLGLGRRDPQLRLERGLDDGLVGHPRRLDGHLDHVAAGSERLAVAIEQRGPLAAGPHPPDGPLVGQFGVDDGGGVVEHPLVVLGQGPGERHHVAPRAHVRRRPARRPAGRSPCGGLKHGRDDGHGDVVDLDGGEELGCRLAGAGFGGQDVEIGETLVGER